MICQITFQVEVENFTEGSKRLAEVINDQRLRGTEVYQNYFPQVAEVLPNGEFGESASFNPEVKTAKIGLIMGVGKVPPS